MLVETLFEQLVKLGECVKRGKHMFGLDAKCIVCGAEADAPTLLEVLRDALPKKEGSP
jgi:hypothetical protein